MQNYNHNTDKIGALGQNGMGPWLVLQPLTGLATLLLLWVGQAHKVVEGWDGVNLNA